MSLDVAAIILAAGRSSRLGRPKQLVPFNGRTLLRHAVQSAIYSPVESVTVVLGAFYPTLAREVRCLDARIVKNGEWSEGMGSSLKSGLRHVLAHEKKAYDGFLFLTCDQPLVDESMLSDLYCEFSSREDIVAASYNATVGVPAIVGRAHLENLLNLKDDAGARALLKSNDVSVKKVPCRGGEFDIDTASDLVRLKKIHRWWASGSKRKDQPEAFLTP